MLYVLNPDFAIGPTRQMRRARRATEQADAKSGIEAVTAKNVTNSRTHARR